MAYALIANTASATTADGTTTGAINTTGADFIVAVVGSYVAEPQPTLSDSQSNTWTPLTVSSTAALCQSRLWYCQAPTTSPAHTFTLAGTTSFPVIAVAAFSGSRAIPFDVENGATQSGVTSLQTGSVTPSANNALLVTGMVWSNTLTGLAIDLGFAISSQQTYGSGINWGGALAWLALPTAAATNPSWSWTGAQDTAVRIATFFPAVGMPGGVGRVGLYSPRGTTQPVARGWA